MFPGEIFAHYTNNAHRREEARCYRGIYRRPAQGVGGSFDVFAGKVRRAPAWMRRRGLEWVYRVATNPRRITKVAKLPRFVWLVIKHGSNAPPFHQR